MLLVFIGYDVYNRVIGFKTCLKSNNLSYTGLLGFEAMGRAHSPGRFRCWGERVVGVWGDGWVHACAVIFVDFITAIVYELLLSEAQGAMYLVAPGWPYLYVPAVIKYMFAWSSKLMSPKQSCTNFQYFKCLLHSRIRVFLLQLGISDVIPLAVNGKYSLLFALSRWPPNLNRN